MLEAVGRLLVRIISVGDDAASTHTDCRVVALQSIIIPILSCFSVKCNSDPSARVVLT